MENTEVGGNRGETLNTGVNFDMSKAPEFGQMPEAELAELAAANAPKQGEIMDFSEMAEMTPEMKPLAADGSTEKAMGKIAVDLMGDVIDKATEKEIAGKISELKKDPYGLANYRDTEMTESLRNNFGRIFGNDQGEAA